MIPSIGHGSLGGKASSPFIGTWVADSNVSKGLPTYVGSQKYYNGSIFKKNGIIHGVYAQYNAVPLSKTLSPVSGKGWGAGGVRSGLTFPTGYMNYMSVCYAYIGADLYAMIQSTSGITGYKWNGAFFDVDSSFTNGLDTTWRDHSTLSLFYVGTSLCCVISWNLPGTPILGYKWNNSTKQWESYNCYTPYDDQCQSFSSWQYGGSTYAIIGERDGTLRAKRWGGSSWVSNTAAQAGLPTDVGNYSYPTVLNIEGAFYAVIGNETGTFNGYKWTPNVGWADDTSIVSGLATTTTRPKPFMIRMPNGTYNLAVAYEDTSSSYQWKGTSWTTDRAMATGFQGVSGYDTLTAFENGGELYTMQFGDGFRFNSIGVWENANQYDNYAGIHYLDSFWMNGNLYVVRDGLNAYRWTGSGFTSDNSILSGLPEWSRSGTHVVYLNGTYFCLRAYGSAVYGYWWNGSSWIQDTPECPIAAGITTSDASPWHPNVFYNYNNELNIVMSTRFGWRGFRLQ